MSDVLPDLLVPGLRVVFCGTAAGAASARRGAYYAGPGNRFWPILFATGLTPRRLRPEEFVLLPTFGIGLTDVAKTVSGADVDIPARAFDRVRLAAALRTASPRIVAFNGKKAASLFLGVAGRDLFYGRQPGEASIFVLPSTSGLASGFWSPAPWFALAAAVRPAA